jgi:hypothetical protein
MGGTGLEPVTPSLSSYYGRGDTRRLTTTIGSNHAGLRDDRAPQVRMAPWVGSRTVGPGVDHEATRMKESFTNCGKLPIEEYDTSLRRPHE